MTKQIFTPDQFTPTQHSSAADKAKFANHFVDFVRSGYRWSKFHKWFYTRLSMTFGHIAHYNQSGFYQTFFDSGDGLIRFWRITMQYGCYGSPAYTYCDVERALQEYFTKHPA